METRYRALFNTNAIQDTQLCSIQMEPKTQDLGLYKWIQDPGHCSILLELGKWTFFYTNENRIQDFVPYKWNQDTVSVLH
jgi:hypothetical protein